MARTTSSDATVAEIAQLLRDAMRGDAPVELGGPFRTVTIPHAVISDLIRYLEGTAPVPDEAADLPREITTGQAADLLGVSRPTVVALVDRGQIPATRVGTRRRLRTLDVLAYRTQARSRSGMDDITALSNDLGLYDT